MFLYISACSIHQQKVIPEPVEATREVSDFVGAAPDVTLDKALLTKILSAEIAIRRGALKQAYELMYNAASISGDPRLAVRSAYWAMRSGLPAQARQAGELWLHLLKQSPESSLKEVYLLLAASSIELAQTEDALKFLSLAQQEAGGDQNIYKRIARDFIQLNDTQTALAVYQQMLASAPETSLAYVGLAMLALHLGDDVLAAQAVDQALFLDPKLEDAALIKLTLLSETDAPKPVYTFARKFLLISPSSYRFRMDYARFLVFQNKYQDAINQYKKIAKLDKELAIEANLAVVSLALENEKYVLAEKTLARMLKQNPGDNQLRYFRCKSFYELQAYSRALEWCSLIRHGDYYFPAQLEIASIMAAQDQLESSIAFLEFVSASGLKQSIDVVMRKQAILVDAKQVERALLLLNKSMMDYPDNTSLLYARGLVLARLNRVKAHEQDMRRLIQLEPDNAYAYNALGYTLADLTDRYTEALRLVERANQLVPNDAFILDSLGWVYFKLNDLQTAKKYLEQAFSIRKDAEIAAHLGEIYWVTGEKSKARKIWQQSIKRTPDNDALLLTIERFL